jgi:hypothetical protein
MKNPINANVDIITWAINIGLLPYLSPNVHKTVPIIFPAIK